jgi:diguanylate cyclase (GGDEF)-like protein
MYLLLSELSATVDGFLRKLSNPLLLVFCLVWIGLIGTIDYLLEPDLLLFTLYLIPVSISAWRLGRRSSDGVVVLSAITWGITYLGTKTTLAPWTMVWNILFFSIMLWTISVLLSNLKVATEVEKGLTRVDVDTGAINKAYFMELLDAEYNRSQRYGYPLTLSYVEFDRVESITGRYGQEGIQTFLAEVADELGLQLRSNDVVGRLDKFDFGILLPHTGSEQADVVLGRLKQALCNLMADSSVQCRVGGMTFLSMPDATEDLVEQTKALLQTLNTDEDLQFMHEVIR